ncbi:PC4 and SFRS1-interacting protein-like [Aplochiton taeniatus]
MTVVDSTLHRLHGDLRISLKTDNPDISRCLLALEQLSMIYVTSQHIQRHSELVSTLRKMRRYRGSRAVMDKASMLYSRFKNAYLLGEGEEMVSSAFLRSLLEEKEKEEAQRWEEEEGQRRTGQEEEKPELDWKRF